MQKSRPRDVLQRCITEMTHCNNSEIPLKESIAQGWGSSALNDIGKSGKVSWRFEP